MARRARKKSESGIYHIMMRGINRQNIFYDEEDREQFLATIKRYKEQCGYEIYAYCLMSNHVHLLLKVGQEPLEQMMRRICGSYVYRYNQKYQRIGNLFQDRFRSEAVETDAYFLVVQRYIHQNPLKAGLVNRIEHYKWSSFNEYVNKTLVVDRGFLLKMFSENPQEAVHSFIEYNDEVDDCVCLDMEERIRINDDEAIDIINKMCGLNHPEELRSVGISSRNKYLKELKEKYSLSVRQIERLTGINRGVILRA